MTDREFLLWMRQRIIHKYGENEHVDFVYKLGNIALAIPKEQITYTTLRDLKEFEYEQ